MPLVYHILQAVGTPTEEQAKVEDAKKQKNKSNEALATLGLARAQADVGALADALSSAIGAVTTFRESKDKKGEARALYVLSVVQLARGLTEEALYSAREALKLARDAKDQQAEAAALYAVAEVRVSAQDVKEAVAAAQEAVTFSRKVADKRGEVLALSVLSTAQLGQQAQADAEGSARDAAAVSQEVQELSAQGRALDAVTAAFQASKTLETAVDIMQRAKDHYKNANNKAVESLVVCKLAKVCCMQTEFSTAIMLAKQAVALTPDNKASTAVAHVALANGYLGNEDFDDAVKESLQAAEFYRQCGDMTGEISALEVAVNSCLQKNDPDEGLRLASAAMERFQAAGQKGTEATMMLAVAEVTLATQDVEGALVLYKKARSVYNQIKDTRGEAMTFHKIGQISATIGDIEEALWSTQRALALYRKIKDKSGEAGVLLVSADMSFAKAWGFLAQDQASRMQQEAKEALRNGQLAAAILKSAGDRQAEAIALLSAGNAQLMLKDAEGALKSATACVEICEAISFDQGRSGGLLLSAGAHLIEGRVDLAQQQGSEARQLLRQRGDALGEEAASSFLKDVSDFEAGTYKKERFAGFYLRGTDSFQAMPAEVAAKTGKREEKKAAGGASRMNTNQSQIQIFSPSYEIFCNIDGFETRAAAGSQTQTKLRRVSEEAEQQEQDDKDAMELAGLPVDAGPRYRAEAPPMYAIRWQGIPSQPGRPKPEGHVARIEAGAEGPLKDIIDAGPVGAGTYFPPMFRIN